MIKILFLTNTPSSYRVEFFNCLGKMCDLTVLFETEFDKSRDRKWTSQNYESFKAVFLRGKRCGDSDAFCPEAIRYLNKSFDLIVIGAYHTPTGMLAIEYMRMRKLAFIISSDGGLIKSESRLKYKWKRHLIGSADAWLSTGSETTNYLEYYGATQQKVYIYPFTSVSQKDILKDIIPSEEKNELRKELHMSEPFIILSVGQFIHRKGYDILLRACRKFSPQIGVYIVGGEPTEEYLQLKEQFDLNQVHFVEFKEKHELQKYYKSADIFVLPTREDIWGLVVNEAMANGLPVVTTDKCVAGIEMVDGKNGKIIPSNSEEKLIEAIDWMKNADLAEYSQNALETAKKYSIENMAEVHMNIFMRWWREQHEE